MTPTRILTAAVVAVLVAALPTYAGSGPTHKNVHFTETIDLASLSASQDVYAIHDSVAGDGAGVSINHYSSATAATDVATTYYRGGTTRAKDTYTLSAPDPDGIITISGTGHDVGGTGRFKHLRSTYTITGTYDTKANVGHFTVKGTLSY